MGLSSCLKSGWKSPRKPPSSELRMRRMAPSLGGGTHSMLKWRTKRGVRSWRPPPGGAQADTMVMSSMSFQKSFLRS